ncbi:hypothetical protein C2G38_2176504 [Gigaspora rosea]|uniref:Uncharacterized protein n=1 Tax=Gigaspora rosea TaxID=44941 RepID=A0A397VHK2_9GLOM|nr:hypothetical protein C2G38_2176504 [Gigaspora rosea]
MEKAKLRMIIMKEKKTIFIESEKTADNPRRRTMYFGALDAYYDLDKPVEELLEDAGFGSNVEQEDELEVFLKEIMLTESNPKNVATNLIVEMKEARHYCRKGHDNETRINKVDNKTLESVRRAINTDYIDRISGLSLENSIETSRNYTKYAKMGIVNIKELQVLGLEEEIVGDKVLDKSNHGMLDNNKSNKERNNKKENLLEGEALHSTCEKWIEKVNKF